MKCISSITENEWKELDSSNIDRSLRSLIFKKGSILDDSFIAVIDDVFDYVSNVLPHLTCRVFRYSGSYYIAYDL